MNSMKTEVMRIDQFGQSDDAKKRMEAVLDHELPPVLKGLIDEYVTFEEARNHFMWKWVHELAPQNTLPCVNDEYRTDVPTDKTITILFVTLLDDVLEKRRDRVTFEEASKIPFDNQTIDWNRDGLDTEYVEFTAKVWSTLVDRLRRAPKYERYDQMFRYDVKQAINAIEYTNFVIEQPHLATLWDLELYESHNMAMFAYSDIDLMHSTVDVKDDYAPLRQVIWYAQQMCRIGNWLSTWERELQEGDCSSGVLVYALEQNIVTVSDVTAVTDGNDRAYREIAERINDHNIEEVFLRRWEDHHNTLVDLQAELSTMDLTPFIEGLEEVLRYHLASKGLK